MKNGGLRGRDCACTWTGAESEAAAVLFNERAWEWTSLGLFLGLAEQHTFYEAETAGAVLGSELVKRSRRRDNVVSVARAPSSASHALDTALLHSRIAAVKKKHAGLEITVRWHQDVAGNEQVDTEASH